MTGEQAAAARRVIDAAKRIERASEYGVWSDSAHREYDAARAEQARTSYDLAGGAS
jgi:hypothetical protein